MVKNLTRVKKSLTLHRICVSFSTFFSFCIYINDNMTETFSFAFNFKLKKVFANKIEKN